MEKMISSLAQGNKICPCYLTLINAFYFHMIMCKVSLRTINRLLTMQTLAKTNNSEIKTASRSTISGVSHLVM